MSQRAREPRKPVRIGVRLKDNAGWSDAQILNLSSRGVMALCQDPPRRGSYVEIRRGTYVMIGRVAWTGTDRIGVHVRERIEVEKLLRPPGPGRNARPASSDVQMRVCDRRQPSLDERAEASARFARAFDFAVIAVVAVGLAVVAAGIATRAFAGPAADVMLALEARTR